MTKHALYGASTSHRWTICPGSIALSRNQPNTSSAAAVEGTMLHALTESCLREKIEPVDLELMDFEFEDHGEHKVMMLTDEHLLLAQTCTEFARSFGTPMSLEARVSYSAVLGLDDGEGFGTLDFMTIVGTTVHIADWKFGRHWVDVDENPQLTLYAAAVVRGLLDVGEEVDEVVLHIMQPRVNELPQSLTYAVAELMAQVEWFKERAQVAKDATESFASLDDKAWCKKHLTPTGDGCRYCPARSFCPALAAVTDEALDLAPADKEEFADVKLGLTADQLAEAHAKIGLLKIWIDSIETEVQTRLIRGDKVTGLRLIVGRAGNRNWTDEEKVVEALKALDITDYIKPGAVLSPAQIDKLIKKQVSKDKRDKALGQMDAFVKRNPAKPTVASVDQPGTPWTPAADAGEFDEN